MNRGKDKTGRFAYMPFYEKGELDELCETAMISYMARYPGGLILPIPTDRLTALIERDAADLDLYADLTTEGQNVHGVTIFKSGDKPAVRIERTLAESPGRQHRFRTTLAHEWGHVALHDAPFQEKSATRGLFDELAPDTARCNRDSITGANKFDWMEWQAGYVCGALLMPKTYVLASADQYCERYRCKNRIVEGTGYVDQLAVHISNEFHVSEDAARVRITQLGLVLPKPSHLQSSII